MVVDSNEDILLSLYSPYIYNYPGDRALVVVKKTDHSVELYKLGNIHGKEYPLDVGDEGVRCASVGSSIYLIGGQDLCGFFTNTLYTLNPKLGNWEPNELPFYSSHVNPVVYGQYIYIFPSVYPFYYKGVDDLWGSIPRPHKVPKNASQPYMYDTLEKEKSCDIPLPFQPDGLRVAPFHYDPNEDIPGLWRDDFWKDHFPGFRVCAAWDEKGLLVSMFEGDKGLFLHDPKGKGWKHLQELKPLPCFPGKLPSSEVVPLPFHQALSGILNGKLYCWDLPDLSVGGCDLPDLSDLHVYDLNEGKVDYSHKFPNHPPGIRGWRMQLQEDNVLDFVGYLNGRLYGKGEYFYLKVKVSKYSADIVKEVKFCLPLEFYGTSDFMLIDFFQFEKKDLKIERFDLTHDDETSYSSTDEEHLLESEHKDHIHE